MSTPFHGPNCAVRGIKASWTSCCSSGAGSAPGPRRPGDAPAPARGILRTLTVLAHDPLPATHSSLPSRA
jgi:hypothetical protein